VAEGEPVATGPHAAPTTAAASASVPMVRLTSEYLAVTS